MHAKLSSAEPRSAVDKVLDCRYVSDCRSGGVASLIATQSHTFMEIDHEIFSRAFLLPSPDSRRVVVSYKRKYVHEVLVNCLLWIKVWLGDLTVPT